MLLAVFPDAMQSLREEHDRVFNKDFDKTLALLLEKSSLIHELKYTQAVINETLRLFPVGMIVRNNAPDLYDPTRPFLFSRLLLTQGAQKDV